MHSIRMWFNFSFGNNCVDLQKHCRNPDLLPGLPIADMTNPARSIKTEIRRYQLNSRLYPDFIRFSTNVPYLSRIPSQVHGLLSPALALHALETRRNLVRSLGVSDVS